MLNTIDQIYEAIKSDAKVVLGKKLAAIHKRYKCSCQNRELRFRFNDDRMKVWHTMQCVVCGKTSAIPFNIKSFDGAKPLDGLLYKAWLDDVKKSKELEISAAKSEYHERIAALDKYRETFHKRYLRTDAWSKKKALVRLRSREWCERCGKKKGEEVHHLTYDRLGDELLTDLVHLCGACHNLIHSDDFDVGVPTMLLQQELGLIEHK